jgi:hypothetical protein
MPLKSTNDGSSRRERPAVLLVVENSLGKRDRYW